MVFHQGRAGRAGQGRAGGLRPSSSPLDTSRRMGLQNDHSLEHSAVRRTPHDVRHILAVKTTMFLGVGHVVCGSILIILCVAGARGIGGAWEGTSGGRGPLWGAYGISSISTIPFAPFHF
jgi:hypothetical protein